MSTGLSIKSTWNDGKERSMFDHVVNSELDNLERHMNHFLTINRNRRGITHKEVKLYLNSQEKPIETVDYFKTWKRHLATKKNGTYLAKKRGMEICKEFVDHNETTFNPARVDQEFYDKYLQYLEGRGFKTNTIGRFIKELKAFLNRCDAAGTEVHPFLRSKLFLKPTEEVEAGYLSEEELDKLYHKKTNHEHVKFLFIAACYAGLRFSDWHKISTNNLITKNGVDMLEIRQDKVKQTVKIPVHKRVADYMKRYGDKPLPTPQHVGRVLKEWFPKVKKIGTHTARRSFATNSYLAGLDTILIMNITGHKSIRTLLEYIKIDKEERTVMASKHKFFK